MQNSGAKLVLYYIYILYCRLYKAHNQTIIDLLNLLYTILFMVLRRSLLSL